MSGSLSLKFANNYLTGYMPMALMTSKLQYPHSATESPCKWRTHSWKPQGGGVGKVVEAGPPLFFVPISLSMFSLNSQNLCKISDIPPGSLFCSTASRLSWKVWSVKPVEATFPPTIILGQKDTVKPFKTLWSWAREVQNMARPLHTDHTQLPAADLFGSPPNFVRGDKS